MLTRRAVQDFTRFVSEVPSNFTHVSYQLTDCYQTDLTVVDLTVDTGSVKKSRGWTCLTKAQNADSSYTHLKFK